MKRFVAYISTVLLVGGGLLCNAETITLGPKQFDTVMEAQLFIEESLTISEREIESNIPYTIIYDTLGKRFDTLSYQPLVDQIKAVWTKGVQPWNLKKDLSKKFGILKNMIVGIDQQKTEKRFAQQKYLLYSLLEYTQQLYNPDHISNTTSLQESNSKDNEHGTPAESNYLDTKSNYLDTKSNYLDTKSNYLNTQTTYLKLVNNNQSLTLEKNILLSQLVEKILQQEIGSLLDKQLLNLEDVEVLDGKIELNYINGCGATKGSYHMIQKSGGTDRKLKAIRLNINICAEPLYLQNFDKYVRQIFIHELAHYFYYFKDSSPQAFDSFCWGYDRNICSNDDFVSSYAQKSKEEDYAESFAYRYLGYLNGRTKEHGSSTSGIIKKKDNYFENRF